MSSAVWKSVLDFLIDGPTVEYIFRNCCEDMNVAGRCPSPLMHTIALAVLALCLACGSHLLLRSVRAHWIRKQMPPGPRGVPLLGNLLQIPQFQWLRFTEWTYQYGAFSSPCSSRSRLGLNLVKGPIFSLNLAGQNVVVINDFKTAADLFGEVSHCWPVSLLTYVICRSTILYLQ